MDTGIADLDLRDLRTLSALYEHGSLSAAAETLGMTVSALSHRVSEMERRLGVPLAERGAHGLRLTDAALALLPYAQAALRSVDAAGRVLQRVGPSGRRVGVARMLLGGRAGAFLIDALRDVPNDPDGPLAAWTIRVGNSREVETWVRSQTVDFGLVRVGGSRPGLRFSPVGADPLMAVATPALLEAAGSDPWLLGWVDLADHTGHGRAVREELRRAGVRLRTWLETDSLELAHRIAREGLAAVVLPESMVAADVLEGRLRAVEVPGVLWPSRQIAVVWSAERERAPWQEEWTRRLVHRFAGREADRPPQGS